MKIRQVKKIDYEKNVLLVYTDIRNFDNLRSLTEISGHLRSLSVEFVGFR